MKYIAGCLSSAILGSFLMVWLTDLSPHRIVVAQDRSGPRLDRRGPGFPSEPAPPPPPRRIPDVFDENGLSPEEAVNVAVYENVNKSVVNITTKSTRGDAFFFLEVPSEGTGSGSILDESGHILTNYHVVEGASEVAVTLYNGKTFDATFVGADEINDIAVIRIEAPQNLLFPVVLGDSSQLKVGMRVFALGNPFGLERTLTTGIISSLNRSLQLHGNRSIRSIIQIDAAINPGNSGGPLLDSHARLIGMNTAIASNTGQSSGVGFAIPSNLISRVVPQLIRHGRVIRPEIGIQRVFETEQGLLVARLTPNGPAERAGLRGPSVVRRRRGPIVFERVDQSTADLIVGVDGKEIKTADDFLGYIESKRPGDTVTLIIIRDDRPMEISVTLGGGPPGREPPR